MSDPGHRGPQSEDLQFKPMGEATEFGLVSRSIVDYVTVSNSDEVLGLLWFSDASGAAAFSNRRAAGGVGLNAGVAWHDQLGDAFRRDLLPSEAVASFATTDLGAFGHIEPGSQRQAADSDEVDALADRMS